MSLNQSVSIAKMPLFCSKAFALPAVPTILKSLQAFVFLALKVSYGMALVVSTDASEAGFGTPQIKAAIVLAVLTGMDRPASSVL